MSNVIAFPKENPSVPMHQTIWLRLTLLQYLLVKFQALEPDLARLERVKNVFARRLIVDADTMTVQVPSDFSRFLSEMTPEEHGKAASLAVSLSFGQTLHEAAKNL